jgi:exodeoxyribonuclease V alpha subunit
VEKINATIVRVRYQNAESGFNVVTCRREESNEELTVVGVFHLPEIDELVSITGEWQNNARFGRQFNAESVMPIIPTSIEGIRSYLAAGHVKGIGETLAKRLVKRFGADVMRVIDESPQRLLEMPGIGQRTLTKIKESWQEQRGVRDVMVFLAAHGLSGARAFRIQKQYGDRAVSDIRANPYRLAYEVRGIGFSTADTIARKLGHDERSPFRMLAGLQHVIGLARRSGHCGMAVDEAVAESAKLLGVEPALLADTIAMAIEMRMVVEETMNGRRVLFEPSLHRAESRIAASLAERADERPPWTEIGSKKAVALAEAESGIALDATQKQAVDLALRSKAIVITGGPGVGKTTLVRALLAVYESAGLTVSLAAPTGRAAKRLSENTGSHASTIHRLLETSAHTGHFQRNEENPLETDVVIVDEASMVDVPLLDAVLRALPPTAGIVLVGDADQLPSIGPGQVLYDILESGRVPSIRLTEIHRQAEGSDIIVNAHRINRGEMPLFNAKESRSETFLFPATLPEQAVARVVDVVTRGIPEKFGLKSLRDVQVLVPMRSGAVGVDALNEALQKSLNPPDRHKARVERPNRVFFCRNDKVMQIENNYDKGVFNGDVGIVAMVDPVQEQFTVDFGADLIVDYLFDEADQLTLAYATTIHKSQGSEYEAVVIALMKQHYVMLRRNLLYTAVTRGRKVVVVVGDRDAVRTAVQTGSGGERLTRLRAILTGITRPRA